MKEIPVTMVRENLTTIPAYPLPEGFRIVAFRDGDEQDWARIETAVDEFATKQHALARFTQEFSPYMDAMKHACLFIENEYGEKIATITAWYGDLVGKGEVIGRIHWVAIVPAYQGRKLAKPLLSAAMNLLAKHHEQAYLTSQTTSYQAINLYLNYGFKPLLTTPRYLEAWTLLEETLQRKIIAE